jgi:hypothetical protein
MLIAFGALRLERAFVLLARAAVLGMVSLLTGLFARHGEKLHKPYPMSDSMSMPLRSRARYTGFTTMR